MRKMGSVFHSLCPRYSGTLTPLPLRLLGYGKPLPLAIEEINWMIVYAHMTGYYMHFHIPILFPDSGSVMCVDSVPVGTDHLVTVYNSGTVNNINTFRFSCFVSTCM